MFKINLCCTIANIILITDLNSLIRSNIILENIAHLLLNLETIALYLD